MPTSSPFHRTPRGFTLVELLVVLAIVGILFTLGLSAAFGAIDRAQSTKCLNVVRQVGSGLQMYVTDNSGRLPNTGHVRASDGTSLSWTVTLKAYLGANFVGRCPSNAKSPSEITYAWNDFLTETTGEGIYLTRCRTPASTLALAETADNYTTEHFHFKDSRSLTLNQFKNEVGVERHGKSANYLFLDGHVESLSSNDINTRLREPKSTFINPNP